MSAPTRAYFVAAMLTIAWACGHAAARGMEDEADAGTAAPREIPTFFLREVTGPRPNLARCLVCRYGHRPVVLLCVRRLDDAAKDLIEQIDRVVDENRGKGLRGFAIFIDGEPKETQPKLFNLSRRRKLTLPLTIPVQPSGPGALELSKSAPLTVILYRDLTEQRRIEFGDEELTKERIAEVTAAAEAMVAGR